MTDTGGAGRAAADAAAQAATAGHLNAAARPAPPARPRPGRPAAGPQQPGITPATWPGLLTGSGEHVALLARQRAQAVNHLLDVGGKMSFDRGTRCPSSGSRDGT
ncbi:MAG TPA: hypothetical protein VMV92_35880 [Streptosporangiaceae bacterium]|nr:hypothetical protein [Streptosporangiaceae bacterium]